MNCQTQLTLLDQFGSEALTFRWRRGRHGYDPAGVRARLPVDAKLPQYQLAVVAPYDHAFVMPRWLLKVLGQLMQGAARQHQNIRHAVQAFLNAPTLAERCVSQCQG